MSQGISASPSFYNLIVSPSCPSPDPMSINTSAFFGRYSIFRTMDSAVDLDPATTLVMPSSPLGYYVAIACILLAACVFRLSSGKVKSHVDVPFYKAAKMKWVFDADTLIRDSYRKVCAPLPAAEHGCSVAVAYFLAVLRQSVPNPGNRRSPGFDPAQVHRRAERLAGRNAQCY